MLTGRPLKEIEKLAAKDAAEDLDGEEEGILGMNPTGIAWVETAGGNDAVEMRMQSQVLSPGVKNAEEADLGARGAWGWPQLRAWSESWRGRADRKAAVDNADRAGLTGGAR
jgi:hypothetical protein